MSNTSDDPEDVRWQNLRRLFNPKSIAVVGASVNAAKAGSQALSALSEFPGELFAVNPNETKIQGFPSYPSLAELPEPVDLALLAIPAKACVQAAWDAGKSGVGGIFIVSGGFGETGSEGVEIERQIAEACASSGLRLLGPNTSGFINPANRCVASFVPGVDQIKPGTIGVIAQSGGVNLSLCYLLDYLGEGVSYAVGLGNAVDIGTRDLLEFLVKDQNTKAIALHLEGVEDGRVLHETLRKITPVKPVAAVVAGRSDIGEFAVSHTGKLMGERRRTVAALEQAGVVVVDTLDELAQAATVLSKFRLPPKRSNGMALITGQAGPGLLVADALQVSGISLPDFEPETMGQFQKLLPPMTFIKNPVDTGRPGPGFPEIVQAAALDPAVDAVLVFGISEPAVLDPLSALRGARTASEKPVLFGTLGPRSDLVNARSDLKELDVPMLLGPDQLALAAKVLDADSRLQCLVRKRPPLMNLKTSHLLEGPFDEVRSKSLLQSYGIAVPKGMVCHSRDEALSAFSKLTKPVVVKIVASDIPHKTEVGGIVVNVSDVEDFRNALDRFDRIESVSPWQVLVEEMAPDGVELIVGGVQDPSWGPCVMLGLGGIQSEAMSDTAIGLAPVSQEEVEEMLDSLRGKALLEGFRGLPRCDRKAIGKVAAAIGEILLTNPEIREVEVNPLRVRENTAIALDALVMVEEETGKN